MLSLLALSILCLALVAVADPHGSARFQRHKGVAHRARGDMQLHKRFDATRWTFYDVGLGACGKHNVASDFIVALNSAQFGGGYPGPNCFKSITMSYNGKTTTAVIMDECPGCPYGGLDLSRGLFTFFASESVGVLTGQWWFNDGSGGGGNQNQNKPTTSKPPPPPKTTKSTSVWTPPTISDLPTSIWSPPPTTTKTSTSSRASSSASSVSSTSALPSINYSSGAASGLAVPTGTVNSTPSNPENLNAFNHAIIDMAGLLSSCHAL